MRWALVGVGGSIGQPDIEPDVARPYRPFLTRLVFAQRASDARRAAADRSSGVRLAFQARPPAPAAARPPFRPSATAAGSFRFAMGQG